MNRRTILASFAVAGLATPVLARTQNRQWPPVQTADANLALQGHDPVAYFTTGGPLAGDSAHQLTWNGAVWRFATAENKAQFTAEPTAYAPQFGGYCAWATSRGYIAPGDAQHWRIVDNRLFLNFNDRARTLWEQDITGNIVLGDRNWPRVLTENQG